MDTVPNNGFIRFLDMFNSEIVTLTDPKLVAEFLGPKADHFTKRPKVKKILEGILGNGLVVAEGKDHKVLSSQALCARGHVSNSFLVSTKAPFASIQLQSHQEFIPTILGKGNRTDNPDQTTNSIRRFRKRLGSHRHRWLGWSGFFGHHQQSGLRLRLSCAVQSRDWLEYFLSSCVPSKC